MTTAEKSEAVKKVKPPKKDKPPQGKSHFSDLPTQVPCNILPRSQGAVGPKKDKGAGNEKKKETKLGLAVTKAEDFHEWYRLLVLEAELISTYNVSGQSSCPWTDPPGFNLFLTSSHM